MPLKQRDWTDHLLGRHTNGLESEFPATHVEEVFEVGAEKVNDENIVKSLLAKVVHLGDTG